jgi:hypothetical protein
MKDSTVNQKKERTAIKRPYEVYLWLLREGWLTNRDLDIISAIYKHRFLSLSQIQKLFFPTKAGKISARRRMKKLYDHYLVDRFRPVASRHKSNFEYIYCLDTVGSFWVAQELQCEVSQLHWRKRDNEVQMPYVWHYFETNECYIRIKEACNNQDYSIGAYEIYPMHRGDEYNFSPDISMEIHKGKNKHLFFFEIDRGTEEQQKIKAKVKNYEAYFFSKKGNEKFIMPWIVFLAEEEKRLLKISQWVEEGRNLKSIQYHYCTYQKIESELFSFFTQQ